MSIPTSNGLQTPTDELAYVHPDAATSLMRFLTHTSVDINGNIIYDNHMMSMTHEGITILKHKKRDITIFHGNFPDVAPIIVDYEMFTAVAQTTIVHDMGKYSVKTQTKLSESDVKYFQYLMDNVGSVARTPAQIIMKRNIPSAVVQMLEELGIDYVTEKLFV